MYKGVMVQLRVFKAPARDEFQTVSLMPQLPFPKQRFP
jgi:hypothetical protein